MQVQKIEKGLADTLIKEFKTEDLVLCLNNIGVLKSKEILLSYTDIIPWTRGGAETYIAISALETEQNSFKFIAKALVSMATMPDQQLKDWNSRRAVVSSLGINTPTLYSAINGVIYERFIDDKLSITTDLSESVLAQLSQIAALLDKAGFASRSFTRDLRIEDDKLYYIDFGSDLGEPSNLPKDFAWKHLHEILTPQQISIIEPIYSKIKGS